MNSIFGTSRTKPAIGRLASSQYAIITVGGNSELVQSVNGQYGRTIQSFYEIGSPNVMWVPGPEEGSLDIGRLIGSRGFFSGWTGGECGVIKPVAINLGGGPCVASGGGGLQFQDAMVENVGFQMNAGNPGITESIKLKIGTFSNG